MSIVEERYCRRGVLQKGRDQAEEITAEASQKLVSDMKPLKADPCSHLSPSLSITKACCITGNGLVFHKSGSAGNILSHFFLYPCRFTHCIKYGSNLQLLKVFY